MGVPLLLLFPPSAATPRFYMTLGALAFPMWVATTHSARLLLATWALLGLAVAWAVWEAGSRYPGFRGLVLAGLALAGAANLCRMISEASIVPVDLLLCRESEKALRNRGLFTAYGESLEMADASVPMGTRIMLVGETRGLYWPRPVIHQSPYDEQIFDAIIRTSATGAEAAKRLRQHANYIYMSDDAFARPIFSHGYRLIKFTQRDEKVIDELWGRWIDMVAQIQRARIYRVRRSPCQEGLALPLPLILDEEAWQREYAPRVEMTWQGAEGKTFRSTVP